MAVAHLTLARYTQAIGQPTAKFIPRIPELLKLEGWYSLQDGRRIKLSCRWKDLLRASNTKHFTSCFSFSCCYKEQPLMRMKSPEWLVIMLLDLAGNVQARAYCYLKGKKLHVSKCHGNGLDFNQLTESTLHNVIGLEESDNVYL